MPLYIFILESLGESIENRNKPDKINETRKGLFIRKLLNVISSECPFYF
jgi:hypothetical protein